MRRTRIRILILVSAFAAAFGAPAIASTAEDPAPTASAPVATRCSPGAFAACTDLTSSWDRKRCAAYAKLLVAAEIFASAVALHETDHGIVATSSDMSSAQAVERHVFRRTLETLVADAEPRTPLMTAREADGALNAAYKEVMAVDDPRNLAWGSVDKAGIRKAERAWLAYRDAFVAFAATFETPGLAERIRIELTARRAASLEAFLAD